MDTYIITDPVDGECPECRESIPCGTCPGVSVTRAGVDMDINLFYQAVVDGMDCCCIGDHDLFPYEFSGVLGSQPGPCLPAYSHSKNPVVWTLDESYTHFVVDGDPRFDSALEVNGVQILNGIAGDCCSDIVLSTTVLPTTTSFPITGGELILRIWDYCKVVSGVGNFLGFPNQGSVKGRFCVCKAPAP